MAENVKVQVKGTKVTMEVDLAKSIGPSASGKTTLIGKCSEKLDGNYSDVTVQVLLYRKP